MTDKTELATASETSMATVEEEEKALAELAKGIGDGLASVPRISTRGGEFTFPDGHVEQGPLNFVVVAAAYSRTLWHRPYDPDSRAPNGIVCASISDSRMDKNTMVPFDSAVKKPSTACNGCPEDEWGEVKGRRKKIGNCGDCVRFVIMSPDLRSEEMFLLDSSPTGIKDAGNFFDMAKVRHMHPVRAIGIFDFVKTEKGAKRLTMKVGDFNDNWLRHRGFMETAERLLHRPPRWFSPEQPVAAEPEEPDVGDTGPKIKRSRSAAS